MRLLWKREKCKFFEGCRECASACPKKALEVGDGGLSLCRHCAPKYAACKAACPNNAISEGRTGVLTVSTGRCDGCGKCAKECANKGIRLANGKAVKCDLCAGKEPACIAACPNGALMLEEGERGGLIEGLQAVEFGPASETEGATRVRAPQPISGEPKPFRPRFIGDGRRIPTVRSGVAVESGCGRKSSSGFSFRNLALPPKMKAELLEARGRIKVLRLEGGANAYFYDLPVFTDEEWATAAQAKYFAIREAAAELFSGDAGSGYFDRRERERRLAKAAAKAEKILGELDGVMADAKKRELARVIAADTVGFGPVELLWAEGSGDLEEIEINHPLREIVVYHRKYGRCITNLALTGEKGFRRVMNAILHPLGTSLDDAHPSVDAQLPDGSRLHAQIYPLALSGASANIRFLAGEPWTVARLAEKGALGAEMAAFLWMAIEARRSSIILTGPPAAGKTSFLSALLAFIPRGERVISVEEDMNELRFYDSFMDWVPLKGVHEERKADAVRRSAGVGAARSALDQVVNALRMRPERMVLGEMRGAEAQRLFSGANLGVPFMATMHSNERGTSVVKRLHSPPMSVPTESLSHLDLVVSMGFDGERKRRVMELSELSWKSRGHFPDGADEGSGRKLKSDRFIWADGDDKVYTNPLYEFDYARKKHAASQRYPSHTLEAFGRLFAMKRGEVSEELARRAALIQALADSGRTGFLEVGKIVQEYSTRETAARDDFVSELAGGGKI